MNPVTQVRIPAGEALEKDQTLRDALDKIKSGELTPAAPCDAVFNTWPQGQKTKLVSAMKSLFPV